MREGFNEVLSANWPAPTTLTDKAKRLTSKCKNLRSALKTWSANFSNLKVTIRNISLIIQLLETMEEQRDLSLEEWNFRMILKEKRLALLEQQRIYWKQRGALKWATLGDVGTKFFHANTTIRHRRNTILNLNDDNGTVFSSHAEKEKLWESFK